MKPTKGRIIYKKVLFHNLPAFLINICLLALIKGSDAATTAGLSEMEIAVISNNETLSLKPTGSNYFRHQVNNDEVTTFDPVKTSPKADQTTTEKLATLNIEEDIKPVKPRIQKKYPIRPPKLRLITKPKPSKPKVSYASSVKIRHVNDTRITDSMFKKRKSLFEDVLVLSSSELNADHLSIHGEKPDVHIRYRKVPIKSLGSNGTVQLTYGSRTIPKLLLQKASRPAMYSLHGFIPKPNVQRITTTTTTAPTTHRYGKGYYKTKGTNKPFDSKPRKKYGSSRRGQDVSNDLNTSGSISRNTFSKRRGSVYVPKVQSTLASPQSVTQKYSTQSKHRSSSTTKKGSPGQDYPTYKTIPKTSFNCTKISRSGMFADEETNCQVWHMCQGGRMHSFLCPNGTIFSEKSGVCDWWYNVQCTKTTEAGSSGIVLLPEDKLKDLKRQLFRG